MEPDYKNLSQLNINSTRYITRLSRSFLNRKFYKPADPKIIQSFIPGTVLDIMVKEGDSVKEGDDLMILDSMKMQNKLKSPAGGFIKSIKVKKGDKVSKGTVLLDLR
jgi:biotin carboxyl carrier protein